jgi:hypothetical protein
LEGQISSTPRPARSVAGKVSVVGKVMDHRTSRQIRKDRNSGR